MPELDNGKCIRVCCLQSDSRANVDNIVWDYLYLYIILKSFCGYETTNLHEYLKLHKKRLVNIIVHLTGNLWSCKMSLFTWPVKKVTLLDQTYYF